VLPMPLLKAFVSACKPGLLDVLPDVTSPTGLTCKVSQEVNLIIMAVTLSTANFLALMHYIGN